MSETILRFMLVQSCLLIDVMEKGSKSFTNLVFEDVRNIGETGRVWAHGSINYATTTIK